MNCLQGGDYLADVKWIKITTDIFDDEKILLIESMPGADATIAIWFKLLVLAGKQNNNGVFMMSNKLPYTEDMLATIFRRDVNTVKFALQLFEKFGMIEIIDNVITIPNWNKHQSLDAYERKKERDKVYQKQRREKQKNMIEKKSSDKSSDVAVSEEEKEEDKEEDKEKENNINYINIVNMYNDICISFPRVTKLSDGRRKAIKARLRIYTIDDFRKVFELAEESDFLKGCNNRNWSATFDWLVKDANMAKVLDGNYSKNKGRKEKSNSLEQNEKEETHNEKELTGDEWLEMMKKTYGE